MFMGFKPRWVTRWLAAGLAAGALAGCAPALESGGDTPPPLAPWVVVEPPPSPATGQTAAPRWTPESVAAVTDGATWAQRLAERAEVTVRSASGRPGPDGQPVRLHQRLYANRQGMRGWVVIVPGFTEGMAMYAELTHDLLAAGYSVALQDHRGQGFSSRLMPGTLGHTDRFDHLADDLDAFVQSVSAEGGPAGGGPLYAVAHSMGGAVLAEVLQRRGAASPFAAVALVTPMFEPATAAAGAQGWVDRALQAWCHQGATAWTLPDALGRLQVAGAGFERELAAFQQAVQAASADRADPAFDLSHSMGRLQQRWRAREATCEGPACGHGDARVAGPTLQWVLQACHGSARVWGPAARRIVTPVLLLNGSEDSVVLGPAQQAFCAQVNLAHPGRCQAVRLQGARHGLLVEADRWRMPALDRIDAFFAQHPAAPGVLSPSPSSVSSP